MNDWPTSIPLSWFTDRGACEPQVAILRQKWGNSIPLSAASFRWAATLSLAVDWWARKWFSGSLRDEFLRQEALLRAQFARQVAQFLDENTLQVTPIVVEFYRQVAELCVQLLGLEAS